jgi:hypothetical protein
VPCILRSGSSGQIKGTDEQVERHIRNGGRARRDGVAAAGRCQPGRREHPHRPGGLRGGRRHCALMNGVYVRLIGIDTPEVGRCGYGHAKRGLDRLVNGRVRLVDPASVVGKDHYGRLLRYVQEHGRDGGLLLLRRASPRPAMTPRTATTTTQGRPVPPGRPTTQGGLPMMTPAATCQLRTGSSGTRRHPVRDSLCA